MSVKGKAPRVMRNSFVNARATMLAAIAREVQIVLDDRLGLYLADVITENSE